MDDVNHTSSTIASLTGIPNQCNYSDVTSIILDNDIPASPSASSIAFSDEPLLLRVAVALNIYYLYGLIVFGVGGNALSALVFLRPPLRSRSSSFFLASLAVVDLLYLLQLALAQYMLADGTFLINQDGSCQALSYLSSVFTFLSIWFIVGFTTERFIAVQYPLHRPHWCTVHRAKRCIGTLVLMSLVSNSYLLVVAGPVVPISDDNVTVVTYSQIPCTTAPTVAGYCDVRREYEAFFNVISILDTLATLLIPLVLIVVMNAMIISQLYASSFVHAVAPPVVSLVHAVSPPTSRYVLASSTELSLYPLTSPTDLSPNRTNQRVAAGQGGRNCHRKSALVGFLTRVSGYVSHDSYEAVNTHSEICLVRSNILYQRAQRQITKMLLLISTVFVVLNLPSYIIRLYSQLFGVESESLRLAQSYAMLLFYTNFATNFLLYSAYGRTFRKALAALLCDCCGRRILSGSI